MSDRVPIINRIATVVEPKEPYLAWVRALDDDNDPSIDSLSREALTSVYLIDEEDDTERALRRHWSWIVKLAMLAEGSQDLNWRKSLQANADGVFEKGNDRDLSRRMACPYSWSLFPLGQGGTSFSSPT